MTIDTIIEDKNEFQRIISSIPDINEEKYAKEVATEIASKYKKLARKYHPDKFGQKKFQSVPYVSQIWFLLVGSKEIRDGIESSFTPYGELIRKYRFPKHWDEEESKKNLGPIQERIQQIRDEQKNDEKVKENVRKEKSLKRKEEEEKEREKERIRKEISLKRRQHEEETERIRREKSLKRKEDEDAKKHKIEEERKEKIRRQDSIELKIQRRKQFTEDEKKFKKEKEKRDKEDEEQQEKIRRQDSLNKKVLRARQFEEDERENKQDILNKKNDEVIQMDIEVIQMDIDDIDDKHLRKQNVRNNTTSRNNTTRRQQNRLNDRISDFMKNKTVKRRELINKYRNKHKTEKMDIVNSVVLPKHRSRTQKKRRSAEDRISDYFTL